MLKALHDGTDPRAGWTSGRVETQADTFGAPPGGVVRMQSSIQQPNVNTANGAGYWPAFWMLGSTLRTGTPWPGSGEVDILEDINGRSSVFGTLHCGVNPGGPCNESTGIGSGEHACSGCQTGYHTYAVEIDRSVSPGADPLVPRRQQLLHRQRQPGATPPPGRTRSTTRSSSSTTWRWAAASRTRSAAAPTPSTVSGGQMNIDYVAVYNKPA